MIVFSDLHLRDKSAETVFQEVFPGLFAAVSKDPDKTLACLGDFWHVRYKIPVSLQNEVLKFLDALEKSGIRLILLPGNHDQVSVEGEHALEVFRKYPNVTIMTEPAWNEYGFWIPYRKRSEDTLRALEFAVKTRGMQPPVLWMHHEILGAAMNSAIRDTTGLDPNYLKEWIVLSGHYHMRQQLGTVRYIGSPYQVDAGEAGQAKGYAVWYPASRELGWVDTNWGTRYHKLVAQEDGSVDLTGVQKGDEVRLVVPAGMDSSKVLERVQNAGASLIATPVVQTSESRLAVSEGAGVKDFAVEYVNQFAEHLDRDQLMSVFMGLCGE
jgi:DNA repair exonuclease SbcCD nuclease subunit